MKLLTILCALGLSTAALAAEKTDTIKVSGWHCDNCPAKTAATVKSLNGVQSAKTNRKKGTLVVKYDDSKTSKADLEKAVADSGFSVAN